MLAGNESFLQAEVETGPKVSCNSQNRQVVGVRIFNQISSGNFFQVIGASPAIKLLLELTDVCQSHASKRAMQRGRAQVDFFLSEEVLLNEVLADLGFRFAGHSRVKSVKILSAPSWSLNQPILQICISLFAVIIHLVMVLKQVL